MIVYDYDLAMIILAVEIIKEAFYNMLISFALFKPMMLLGEIINKSKNSYYLL